MDSGMAMYVYAKLMLDERRRVAENGRLVAELRAARRDARRSQRQRAAQIDAWSLQWADNGLTGKPVTLVNTRTGEKHTGRDPGDWDRALGDVVRQLGVGV